MSGPLEGLLVIDASPIGPGSIAAMVLADYGARVVKVEPPQAASAPWSDVHSVWDRNKWSLILDLDADDDRTTFERLLLRADVLIDAFDELAEQRYGLADDRIAATFPRLVRASISTYGRGGPWSDRPGDPALLAARLGVMAEQDGPRPGPHFLGHPSTLYSTAMLTAMGALASLRARAVTGRGQRVDSSILDGVLALSTMNWWWNEAGASYLARTGTDLGFGRSRIITDLFQCGDGEWLVIHTGGTGGFKRAMDLLGIGECVREIPGLETSVPLDDEEYHAARVLAPAAFGAKPRAEWVSLFHAADLAALPVFRPTEVFDDDQVVHDGIIVDLDDPVLGHVRQVGRCIDYAISGGAAMRPAPIPGADDGRLGDLLAEHAPQPDVVGEPGALAHPLDGVRVLDFSTYFAGPYAARLLSDLGADVIKIEAIEGDPMRPLPDPFEGAQRGKRTIAVDLKSPAGLRAVHELVATADVVMHNFRPGKAEKVGIGYEQLKALRPELVYCYLPGFGSSGPKSGLKSFAPLLSGFVGNFFEGAGDGQPPVRRVIGNEDYYNGLGGAVAVLMAIVCRDRTGRGQALESPQLRSALFATSHNFVDAAGTVHRPFVLDADQYGLHPLHRLYPTSDGHLCIACHEAADFTRLAVELGVQSAIDDVGLVDELTKSFAELTTEHAFARLDAAGVPCEIAIDYPLMPELLWDEWLTETSRVIEQHHPQWGWLREIGVLVRPAATPAAVKGHGPMLGEHTVELLDELGYSSEAVEELLTTRACVAYTAPSPPAEAAS